MALPVIMPKQGQSVETCILTGWFKQKGEEVIKGDLLFSYETDKAAFEEEAKFDGLLLEVFYDAGEEVPVLTNVAVIGNKGESVNEFHPEEKKNSPGNESQTIDKKDTEPDSLGQSKEFITESYDTGKISPRAKLQAKKFGIDVSSLQGSGPGGRIIEKDVIHAFQNRPKITPLAREMMKKEKLVYDREKIQDRITSKDLIRTIPEKSLDEEIIPLSSIRKRIAKAMQLSLQNSAQLTHHNSADVRKILALREKVKSEREKREFPNITLNDMICYAVIKALHKHPEVNGHFLGDHMKLFKKVNLGIAVDSDRGLMVPTLLEADQYTLEELSGKFKELAEKSRKGNIDPDLLISESAGFTISNLGAYGIEMFTPVINLPQIAILGINTIINRPADIGDGTIGLIPYIGLSLTYDHRAIDGGPASLFLREVKEQIEKFDENLFE